MQERISPLIDAQITFAHRGARAHLQENTIAAFELALRLGAIGLESDTWITRDGVAVLDHDGIVKSRLRSRSIDEFIAFDRHSPADPEGTCFLPLFPDENNFLVLKDTCNNATFSLYDGSPMTNSEYGLRQYATQFNGSNLLRIYN